MFFVATALSGHRGQLRFVRHLFATTVTRLLAYAIYKLCGRFSSLGRFATTFKVEGEKKEIAAHKTQNGSSITNVD